MSFSSDVSEDHIFGWSEEKKIHSYLDEAFDTTFSKTKGQYNSFDFISEKDSILLEVKSRHNLKKSFNTTMIGFNKVRKALMKLQEGYSVYFVFNFIDKLCYYQFQRVEEDWKKVDKHPIYGRRENYYIPVEELSDILDW